MSFLIISPNRDPKAWVKALHEAAPNLELEVYPEVKDPEKVEFVLSWRHPHGIFKDYPNLKIISSMGAGIDHILQDEEIPEHIQITRIIDDQLAEDMAVFVLSLILEQVRNLSLHHCSKAWKPVKYLRPKNLQAGIMGMGVLGTAVAKKLTKNDFKVAGWAASAKEVPGVATFHGDEQLPDFLSGLDFLICLLPLTSETENILNKNLFQKLPQGAYLINVARGNHLVEKDLLEMIDNGHLSGASLDVFKQEPLPEDHPFWKHEKIKITPHVASVTHPSSVAPQLIENYTRMKNGKKPGHLVNRQKQY